jgi:hypothetical protein
MRKSVSLYTIVPGCGVLVKSGTFTAIWCKRLRVDVGNRRRSYFEHRPSPALNNSSFKLQDLLSAYFQNFSSHVVGLSFT